MKKKKKKKFKNFDFEKSGKKKGKKEVEEGGRWEAVM